MRKLKASHTPPFTAWPPARELSLPGTQGRGSGGGRAAASCGESRPGPAPRGAASCPWTLGLLLSFMEAILPARGSHGHSHGAQWLPLRAQCERSSAQQLGGSLPTAQCLVWCWTPVCMTGKSQRKAQEQDLIRRTVFIHPCTTHAIFILGTDSHCSPFRAPFSLSLPYLTQ